MNRLTIAGCNIKLQLNGSSLYVIFDGSEEQAQGAFDTLYNVNAYSSQDMADAGAFFYTSTTLEQFARGLFNLALLRLLAGDTSAYKGMRGGLRGTAQGMADAMLASAERCHIITPNMAVYDALAMGSPMGKWDGDDN